jgi:hypothetical protein
MQQSAVKRQKRSGPAEGFFWLLVSMAPGGRHKTHAYVLRSGQDVIHVLQSELCNVEETLWYGQSAKLQIVRKASCQHETSEQLDVLPFVRLSFDTGHTLRLPPGESQCTSKYSTAQKGSQRAVVREFLDHWNRDKGFKLNCDVLGDRRPWPKMRFRPNFPVADLSFAHVQDTLGLFLPVDALLSLVFAYTWPDEADILMDFDPLYNESLLDGVDWPAYEFAPFSPIWCHLDSDSAKILAILDSKSADAFSHATDRQVPTIELNDKTYHYLRPGLQPWE